MDGFNRIILPIEDFSFEKRFANDVIREVIRFSRELELCILYSMKGRMREKSKTIFEAKASAMCVMAYESFY